MGGEKKAQKGKEMTRNKTNNNVYWLLAYFQTKF